MRRLREWRLAQASTFGGTSWPRLRISTTGATAASSAVAACSPPSSTSGCNSVMRSACCLPLSALVAALLLGDASAQGPGGIIRGRVEIRRPSPIERRPNVSDLGMAATPETGEQRRSVVYLESALARAFPDI